MPGGFNHPRKPRDMMEASRHRLQLLFCCLCPWCWRLFMATKSSFASLEVLLRVTRLLSRTRKDAGV